MHEIKNTMNWEILVYENIHVLNVCVNIFRGSHENILKRKFCQAEITVHVLLTA